MLDTSTCFSFAGSEKEDLGKLGHWLYQQVAEMHASQQLLLARSHGSGSYTKILELVSRLTDRGERLVILKTRPSGSSALSTTSLTPRTPPATATSPSWRSPSSATSVSSILSRGWSTAMPWG